MNKIENKNLSVKVYSQEGKEGTEISLSEAVFGVKPKSTVVHQVFVAMQANAREPWADTKGKGEVRGGGKKPWKQKGTGRARHGSSRSPIWRGGGITFGPLSDRNYEQKINKKMNKLAVKMCLADKLNNGSLLIVESLPEGLKTKAFAALQNSLPCKNRKTILAVEKFTENLKKAVGNLPKIKLIRVADLNVMDLLNNHYLLTTKEAIKILETRLA